jgi:hypothetical protein
MDVIVSSDVFEHIIDVDAAHAAVARILAGGGMHVWTTPQYRDLEISRSRVRRSPGGLEFLEPAQYHGDPVNPEGSLVTFDWGRDLAGRVVAASGLWTTVFALESRVLGLSGEFREVFVSQKGPPGALTHGIGNNALASLEITQVRAELRASRDALAAIQTSRSWRATEPLRSITAAARRRLGSPPR